MPTVDYVVDIPQALSNALKEVADAEGYSIAYENIKFSPESKEVYLRETYLPAETVNVSIGENPAIRYSGFYQVDINLIIAKGRKEGMQISRHIVNKFKPGSRLLNNKLLIMSVSPSVGRVDGGRYVIPVMIRYMCMGSN